MTENNRTACDYHQCLHLAECRSDKERILQEMAKGHCAERAWTLVRKKSYNDNDSCDRMLMDSILLSSDSKSIACNN